MMFILPNVDICNSHSKRSQYIVSLWQNGSSFAEKDCGTIQRANSCTGSDIIIIIIIIIIIVINDLYRAIRS